jgi:hypothetical protein
MADGGWIGGPMLVTGLVLALAIVGAIVLVVLLRRAVAGDPGARVRAAALSRVSGRRDGAAGSLGRKAPSGEVDAFLIIPDISGYTEFMQLSHFSLAHAQYVVSALLESVIEAAEDCLATAKVEGDAVLFYALRGPGQGTDQGAGGLSGEEIGRTVIQILRAFYRKRAELGARNTCPCEACRHVDKLELKTVMHGGRLLLYDMRGQQELSGLPVIVAHRLLKNSLGLPRYVLISEAAHGDVPLPLDPSPGRHVERYEGIGEVAARVYRFELDDLLPGEAARLKAGVVAKAGETARKLRENLRTLGA